MISSIVKSSSSIVFSQAVFWGEKILYINFVHHPRKIISSTSEVTEATARAVVEKCFFEYLCRISSFLLVLLLLLRNPALLFSMKPTVFVLLVACCMPSVIVCEEGVTEEMTTFYPETSTIDDPASANEISTTTTSSTTAVPTIVGTVNVSSDSNSTTAVSPSLSTSVPTTMSTTSASTTTTTPVPTTVPSTIITTTTAASTTLEPFKSTTVTAVLSTEEQVAEATAPVQIINMTMHELIQIEKELIPHLLNVSENVVDEKRDKEAELLSWEAPLEIRANYPYYLSGFDAENRPIWVAELGRWNLRKIIEDGGDNFKLFDKYVQQSRARVTASRAIKSTPEHLITEAVFLLDLDQLNLAQIASVPTVAYILSLARQYRKLLTEHTGVCVVVNANFVAESLVNIVRPVLGAILEKTEIYGTNRARWLPHVLRHFPKDQIPEWYGGNRGFTPIQIYG